MYTKVLPLIQRASPVGLLPLAVGALMGIGTGALRLGQSADEATAIGLATSISFSFGMWVGMHAYVLVLSFTHKWVVSLKARFETLAEHLGVTAVTKDIGEADLLTRVIVAVVVVFMATTLLGIVFLLGGAVLAGIDARIDVYPWFVVSTILVCAAGLTLVGLAGQLTFFASLGLLARQIEKRLDAHHRAGMLVLQAEKVSQASGRMHSLLRATSGIRPATT